jgi:hypothetical protein
VGYVDEITPVAGRGVGSSSCPWSVLTSLRDYLQFSVLPIPFSTLLFFILHSALCILHHLIAFVERAYSFMFYYL